MFAAYSHAVPNDGDNRQVDFRAVLMIPIEFISRPVIDHDETTRNHCLLDDFVR